VKSLKQESRAGKVFDTIIGVPEITILIPVVLTLILGSFLSPVFLTVTNMMNIIRSVSYYGIIAIFMTKLLMSRSLDLSCDSVAAFSSVLFAWLLMNADVSIPLAIIIALACSVVIGLVNAILIQKFSIPPFVATLGMMFMMRGIALIVSGGGFVMIAGIEMNAENRFLGMTMDVFVFIGLAVLADLVLRFTGTGRKNKLMGTNLEAAKLSGINTIAIATSLHILTAMAASLGGILFTMRSSIGAISVGTGWALQAITGCILGGTSLRGGKGSVLGSVLGVFFMGLVTNLMILYNIRAEWQNVGIGIFMIFGILLEVYRSRKLSG